MTVAFVLGLLTSGTACSSPTGVCDPEYCEDNTHRPFHCKVGIWPKRTECHPGVTEANFWCQRIGGGWNAWEPDCRDYGGDETGGETGGETAETESPSWNPGAKITYDERADQYYASADFVNQLKADWSLLANDTTVLDQVTTGYYEGYYQLLNVADGDLADVLGLQSGDILLDVNGYDLGTMEAQLTAMVELEHELEFRLAAIRDETLVLRSFVIVD